MTFSITLPDNVVVPSRRRRAVILVLRLAKSWRVLRMLLPASAASANTAARLSLRSSLHYGTLHRVTPTSIAGRLASEIVSYHGWCSSS
ncbi:hypothetical protein Y032_0052g2252 [Ancylostoma ceylanicum]|uniref:Uncharacterized protein n=1 Tax=Ancylostoma ceylanicum TaxID=53326 RepID=A0A016U977_9BILA|nr:hypothetical protein Y032_0052g2252 [Ancylostoma ceylanicum]